MIPAAACFCILCLGTVGGQILEKCVRNKHGSIQYKPQRNDGYWRGFLANVKCTQTGHFPSQELAQCQPSGWTESDCIEGCPLPTDPHRLFVHLDQNDIRKSCKDGYCKQAAEINVWCHAGHFFKPGNDMENIKCQKSRNGDSYEFQNMGKELKCHPVCVKLSEGGGLTLTPQAGSSCRTNYCFEGTVLTPSCAEGLHLKSDLKIKCITNDNTKITDWDRDPPICEKKCKIPSEHKSRKNVVCKEDSCKKNFFKPEAKIEIECTAGFKLPGFGNDRTAEHTCVGSTGEWFPTVQNCVARCKTPDIEHGDFTELVETQARCDRQKGFCDAPSKIRVLCKQGFAIEGSNTLSCDSTGDKTKWNDTIPTCFPQCPVVDVERGKWLTKGKDCRNGMCTQGVALELACDTGFIPLPNKIATCTGDDSTFEWFPNSSRCEVACKQLKPVLNGYFSAPTCTEGNFCLPGITAKTECFPNYKMVGNPITTCTKIANDTAEWVPELPICNPTCGMPFMVKGFLLEPEPKFILNTSAQDKRYLLKTKLFAECDKGFTAQDHDETVCTKHKDGKRAFFRPVAYCEKMKVAKTKKTGMKPGLVAVAVVVPVVVIAGVMAGLVVYIRRRGRDRSEDSMTSMTTTTNKAPSVNAPPIKKLAKKPKIIKIVRNTKSKVASTTGRPSAFTATGKKQSNRTTTNVASSTATKKSSTMPNSRNTKGRSATSTPLLPKSKTRK